MACVLVLPSPKFQKKLVALVAWLVNTKVCPVWVKVNAEVGKARTVIKLATVFVSLPWALEAVRLTK